MKYALSDSDIGKCFRFAIEVTKKTKNYYKLRNKYASTEKMIFDHFIAKMSEIATWALMTSENKECTYPNFNITDKADNGDLKIITELKNITLHCKVVRHDSPVTDSWLIQTTELSRIDPSDFFVLCKFFDPNEIEICTIAEAGRIKWQKPRNASLSSKSACYLNDLYI